MDVNGVHALNCNKGGLLNARHDAIRNLLFDKLKKVFLNPTKEQGGLIPGSQARPGDIFVARFINGKATAVDVTITNPLNKTAVTRSLKNVSFAIEERVKQKYAHYKKTCDANNVYFIPFAMDTFGNFGLDALYFINCMAGQLSNLDLYGKGFEEVKRVLLTECSFTLQNMMACQLASFAGCR